MLYCDRCETEYERGEACMCGQYRRWMESGQKNRVPAEWKIDFWNDYPNDPEDCEHIDFDEAMDGSARCRDCGLRKTGLAD